MVPLFTCALAHSHNCVDINQLVPRNKAFFVPERVTKRVTPTQSVVSWLYIAAKVPFGVMVTRFSKLQSLFLVSGTFSALDSSLQSYGCEIYKVIDMASFRRENLYSYLYLTVRRERCPCSCVLRV